MPLPPNMRRAKYAHDHSLCQDPSWPQSLSIPQRAEIQNRFLEIHSKTIDIGISLLRCSLHHRRPPQDLDGRKHAFTFTFAYRAGTDGNPATQLFIKKVEIVERDPEKNEDEQEDDMAHIEERRKLRVIYRGGGVEARTGFILHPDSDGDTKPVAGDWVTHLRYMTTIGLSAVNEGGILQPGMMRKTGKEWKWTKVTNETLASYARYRWRHLGPEPIVDMGPLTDSRRRK